MRAIINLAAVVVCSFGAGWTFGVGDYIGGSINTALVFLNLYFVFLFNRSAQKKPFTQHLNKSTHTEVRENSAIHGTETN